MSYLDLVDKTRLFETLHLLDKELAQRQRERGCPQPGCSGPLHWGKFLRKPRGESIELPEAYSQRMGLCCGWCRKRVLPPSCLFFGRRVYWGVVVILVSAAIQGLQKRSMAELCKRFGVSRRTVKRWVRYFESLFWHSDRWQRLRGRVIATVCDKELPKSLLRIFLEGGASEFEAVVRCLSFLAEASQICSDFLKERGKEVFTQ